MNRVSIGSDNGLSPIRRQATYQCWVIVNWTPKNKLQWNFNQASNLFTYENATENIVCEMTAILSRGDELTDHHLIYGMDKNYPSVLERS